MVRYWISNKAKKPPPEVEEWFWKDAWFSEAGLLAAAEYECESTEADQGGGGWLGDGRSIKAHIVEDGLHTTGVLEFHPQCIAKSGRRGSGREGCDPGLPTISRIAGVAGLIVKRRGVRDDRPG